MSIYIRTRTQDVRALAGAIALGSGAGLVIGAVYLVGSSRPAAPPAPAVAGSLQAMTRPFDTGAHAAFPTAAQPASPAVGITAALRDRFGLAGFSARPFHFQQVANAPTDLHCLTEAVYFEARGEPQAGQQAVAQVVLNRVRHPAFPKTICAVVHQRAASGCQFSFACGPEDATDPVAWRRAQAVASGALHGAVMTAVGDATHFQAARSSPFAGLLKVAQVGEHIFYRFAGRSGAAAMFRQSPQPSIPAGQVQLARLDVGPPLTVGARLDEAARPSPVATPAPAAAVSPATIVAIVKPPAAAAAGKETALDGSPALTPPAPAKGEVKASLAKPPVAPIALAQS